MNTSNIILYRITIILVSTEISSDDSETMGPEEEHEAQPGYYIAAVGMFSSMIII